MFPEVSVVDFIVFIVYLGDGAIQGVLIKEIFVSLCHYLLRCLGDTLVPEIKQTCLLSQLSYYSSVLRLANFSFLRSLGK